MPRLSDDDKSDEEEKVDKYNIRHDDDEHGRVRTPFMASKREHTGSNNEIRSTRWMAFSRQHSAFGFEKLSDADLPQMSQKAHGITACFEKIQGWKVPKSLLKDLGEGKFEVNMRLSLSLFHMKSSTFFGTTWSSAPCPLNELKTSDTMDVPCMDIIYMISRIIDPTCVGIVEIVATKINKTTKLETARYGCGWAMLSLFDQHRLFDVSEGYNFVQTTSATFYKGSPRDILELSLHNKILDSKTPLQEVEGCQLIFKLFANRKLVSISSLLAENAILSRHDIVPGLELKEVITLGNRKSQFLPCIGERGDGNHILPGYPTLCRFYSAKLSNLVIKIPNKSSFQSALISDIRAGKKDIEGRPNVSKIAKIGFHNGHTVLNGSFVEFSLEDDESEDPDEDILKLPNDLVELSGYIAHEMVALVIVVEYSVGQSPREMTHSFKSIQDSSKNKGKDTSTVTIGAAVFVPLNDGRINIRNGSMDNGDNYDIELDLLTDEKCTLVSPHKVFNIFDHVTNPDEDDIPKVKFDLKMYDWNGREIYHNHEDDQNFVSADDGDDASVSSNEKPVRKSTPKKHYSDSDSDSAEESVHEDRKLKTTLKLDQKYYTARRLEDVGEAGVVDVDGGPSSLLTRSMKVNLNNGRNKATREFLDEKKVRPAEEYMRISEQTREVSRAGRSRLSRHGFHATSNEAKVGFGSHIQTRGQEVMNVDINLESRDRLSLHEITIQFAGYRAGPPPGTSSDYASTRKPRAIYCNYQFYSCTHTRTEYMRILPSGPGEVGVLVRDDSHARNETPLALRHTVDCSDVSTLEVHHFTTYLGHRMLYIDVWDADSHLLLGTSAVPLRKLMRQGQHNVKSVIECDLYKCESTPSIEGGVSCLNIISSGPLIGTIVGSLNIILSNTGRVGRFNDTVAEPKGGADSALNWRLNTETKYLHTSRPKNQVRAKPLSESQPKLSRLLDDQRVHLGGIAPMRSLSIPRANDSTNTITYDELSRLFKRFQGAMKGTIQYSGVLMNLLEVPSMDLANIKFVKAVKKMGSANFKSVV